MIRPKHKCVKVLVELTKELFLLGVQYERLIICIPYFHVSLVVPLNSCAFEQLCL